MRISDWSSDVCSSDLLDLDDVAFLQLVGNLLDALVGNLRHVHQTILARHDRHESAEVHQLGDLAFVDAARLDVGGDLLDALLRRFTRLAIDLAEDDGAVVADVDSGDRMSTRMNSSHSS